VEGDNLDLPVRCFIITKYLSVMSYSGKLNSILLLFMIGIINLSAQKTAPSDDKYIEIDGSRLHYVVRGTGKECLVIGSSVYYPRTFSAGLDSHLKMYFVDMKWFAKEYKPENLDSVNISSIAADVEKIRVKLGLVKPLVLGHSIHGTIAAEYARRYQDKISGVIIIGSPSEWGNATYDAKAKALWETASDERKKLQDENWGNIKELDRLTGKAKTATEYNIMSPQYWYNPRYDAGWLWEGMTVHTEVTNNLFTKVFLNYNMFSPALTLNVPVFVAMGMHDYVIPHTLWQEKYSSIPDFTLVLFDKSGHTPQLEESEKFNRILTGWLGSRFR